MNCKDKSLYDTSEYKKRIFILMLLVLYLLALSWGILFKFQLDICKLRNANKHLKIITNPFFLKDGKTHKFDVLANIIAFIPFGIYLSALRVKINRVLHTSLCIAGMLAVSMSYEYIQFVYKIGCTDVNDCISNTLGGAVGVALYYIIYAVFRKKTNAVICAAGSISTVIAAAVITYSVTTGTSSSMQSRILSLLQQLRVIFIR